MTAEKFTEIINTINTAKTAEELADIRINLVDMSIEGQITDYEYDSLLDAAHRVERQLHVEAEVLSIM